MSTATAIEVLLLRYGGALALILSRASGMARTAPAWGAPALGWRLRLALAATLTAILAPAVGPGLEAPADGVALGRACAAEAAVGAALGMSAALVIAGARQAGELVGGQAGLWAAALLDPEAGD